jgi:hypothetical protein
MEQYFAAVKDIFADSDDATNEAQEELNAVPATASLEEQTDAIDSYLTEIDGIFNEAIQRLDALTVPADAENGHAGFVSAIGESLAAADALQVDLPGIETQEQLDERLTQFDADVGDAISQADDACFELQDIADAEEIQIDLACEE